MLVALIKSAYNVCVKWYRAKFTLLLIGLEEPVIANHYEYAQNHNFSSAHTTVIVREPPIVYLAA